MRVRCVIEKSVRRDCVISRRTPGPSHARSLEGTIRSARKADGDGGLSSVWGFAVSASAQSSQSSFYRACRLRHDLEASCTSLSALLPRRRAVARTSGDFDLDDGGACLSDRRSEGSSAREYSEASIVELQQCQAPNADAASQPRQGGRAQFQGRNRQSHLGRSSSH